jgi:hypothetical protein
MIRNASGVRTRPSTKIIPGIEYTLNGAAESPRTVISRTLITPVDGLRSRVQVTAISNGGMILGTTVMSSKNRRPGASVRTTTQAITAAKTMDSRAEPAAKTNELRITSNVSGSEYAIR